MALNDIIYALLEEMQNASAVPHLSCTPVESNHSSLTAKAIMKNLINKIHSSRLISKFLYAVNKK